MFTNISWNSYLAVICVLLLIWYLAVGFTFYFQELRQIIYGEKKNALLNFTKNQQVNSVLNQSQENIFKDVISSSFSESFDTLKDAEELSERLLKAINESVQRNLSLDEFQNYLRLILIEYPFVKSSALRQKVNELVLSECEKHPMLSLTYQQADSLWEDTVS
jgi:hypothetical protein